MAKAEIVLSYTGILDKTLEETAEFVDEVEDVLKDEILNLCDSSLREHWNFTVNKKINFYEADKHLGERHEVILDVSFRVHCNSVGELSNIVFEECKDLLLDFSLDLEDVSLSEKEDDVVFHSELLLAEKSGGCNCCEKGVELNVDTGETSYDYLEIQSLSIPMGSNASYTVRLCEECRNDLINHLIEMGNLK